MTDHDEEKLMCTHMSMYHEKVFTPAPNKKNHEGPTEIWTRITGFRVQSANHYTMGPFTMNETKFVKIFEYTSSLTQNLSPKVALKPVF